MKNPTDLKYTPDHMWVRIEAGNVASMGVTYFGQEGMGEILYVELPEIGKYLKKEEFLCTLSSPKAMVDLSSPLSGEVVAVNEDLLINPNVVNESPGVLINDLPLRVHAVGRRLARIRILRERFIHPLFPVRLLRDQQATARIRHQDQECDAQGCAYDSSHRLSSSQFLPPTRGG